MLKSGTFIQNYEIIEAAVGSSMGLVYQVRHRTENTVHALRTLSPSFAIDESTRERFRETYLAQIQIDHPNIIAVRDLIEGEGVIGVVTDLARGPSLAEILSRRPDHQYSLNECLKVIFPLVDALAYAHERGLIHRGLQPDRVRMDETFDATGAGTPKLIDFDVPGILCHGTDLRRSPANFGAAPYMTPELARGELDVDARADVFAIGMLFWRMLSGRLPVNPMDLVSLMRVYAGEQKIASISESRPSLPVAFRDLVDRCLSIDPEGRPNDAGAVWDALIIALPEHNRGDAVPHQIQSEELEVNLEIIAEPTPLRVHIPPPIPIDVRPSKSGLPPITEWDESSLPGTTARVGAHSRIEDPTAFFQASRHSSSSVFSTAVQQIVGKPTLWAVLGGLGLALVAIGGWYNQVTAHQLPLRPLTVAQRATISATVSAAESRPISGSDLVSVLEKEPDPASEMAIEIPTPIRPNWRKNKGPCKELIGAWEGTRRHFRVKAEFTEHGRSCKAEMQIFDGERFVGTNEYKVTMNDMHLMDGHGKIRLKAYSNNITGDHMCWFSIRPRLRSRYIGRGCGGKFDIRRL